VEQVPSHNDILLGPWLETLQKPDAEAADAALTSLIETHIHPVIKSVVRFKLRPGASERADESDLIQEAMAEWLAELRKLGSQPHSSSIRDARGLAATIAYRVCYAWLRRRSPRRHAFTNRLQYLLTRQAGFALWHDTAGERHVMVAGFAAWRDRAPLPSEELRNLAANEMLQIRAGTLTADWEDVKLAPFMNVIFEFAGCPVLFNDLVSLTMTLLQIRDDPPASTEVRAEMGGAVPSSGEDLAWLVESRFFLKRLWQEVRELPRGQRAALLLNLKDSDGSGCLELFPATGVATIRQVAETLEITDSRFAEMWPRLPLDDTTIAGLLNLTRQQVINLRKSARERLARAA
jgi:DNA-directed RNA polymerase specialized sigma24 family protein